MKVLFVETILSGHRKVYHKTLIECIGNSNAVLITPEFEPDVDCEQVVDVNINLRPRSLREYSCWIRHIKDTADKYAPTVIHFLDGDLLYRFCGYKFGLLNDYKTIVTFHHVNENLIHSLSVKMISKKVVYEVVHTEYLSHRFKKIKNIRLIEYPYFPMKENMLPRKESRDFYHITSDEKVFLALGGTRYEKGVDILLSSLKIVDDEDVVVLVAGKEEYFKQKNLEKIDTGKVKVIYYMKALTDLEWNMALAVCDYVVLPYRKSFAGASGPLAEAVWYEKPVIGKNDGSIGYMIRENDLGWTFESDDIDSLAQTIKNALCENFNMSDKYLAFRRHLSVEIFKENYLLLFKER